ncbi:MAG: TetR family transcriptional regulator [Sciscionella sp.]
MAARRGRRAAGADTRDALLVAAREVFAESGYGAATVRAIAARADVDPAMVNHWFGGKQYLFAEAVLAMDVTPSDVVGASIEGPLEGLGERLALHFLASWDSAGGESMVALIRSVSTRPEAAQALRELIVHDVITALGERLPGADARLRVTLCGTALIGLALGRYVLALPPLLEHRSEQLAAMIGPTLQRYLTGCLEFTDPPS